MGTWAGLNGRGCPFPSSILERSLKTKGNRIGRGYRIRIGGHLMPENSGVTALLALPNAGIAWGVRMSLRVQPPRSWKEIISATPETSLSIYLASQGFPIVTYVTWGQDMVSEMPRAAPFISHPLTHQGLGSSRGLGVHCCYTVPLLPSVPEYLNPELEALDQQTGERRKEFNLPVLASYHLYPRAVPRPGLLGSTKRQGEPSSKPRIFQVLDLWKFSPTHSYDPGTFSSPAWLFCMWSSTVAWCIMG